MQVEPLLTWSEPVREFIGFVSLFLANGSIGFRYAAVRGRLTEEGAPAEARGVYDRATRRAANLGLTGALIQAVLLMLQLPHLAERMHRSVGQLLTSDPQTIARCVLLLAGILGLALARRSFRSHAWLLAAVGLFGAQLAVILSGRWVGLVNPAHQLFGSLWLGTLLVLVLAGLSSVLRDAPRLRGSIAADMVNGFSPLALTAGPLLVATGITTALLHLHPFSSLYSTPYGYALLVKLCFVALVFFLGAWNWRRQRPRLGSELAAGRIRRSSIIELSVATIVLIVTSILVSLPSPGH